MNGLIVLNKNDIIIVAARKGSKGLRNKNKLLFDGEPMFIRTLNQATRLSNNVIFSSDDEEMLSESLKVNKDIVNIKRPRNLSLSSSAKLPVLRHAINYYLNQGNDIPENIIDLQVTSPLRLDSEITKAYKVFVKQNKKFDNLISISKSIYHPSYNLVKITKNSKATLLDFNKTITGREMLLNNYQINGSIFIWKYSEILKNENGLIRNNTYGFETDSITSHDIDSEIDFIVAEAIYNSKLYKNFIISS